MNLEQLYRKKSAFKLMGHSEIRVKGIEYVGKNS